MINSSNYLHFLNCVLRSVLPVECPGNRELTIVKWLIFVVKKFRTSLEQENFFHNATYVIT